MVRILDNVKISERTELDIEQANFIGDNVIISCKKLKMGKDSQINAGVKIVGSGEIEIGKYCVISYNTVILTASDLPSGEFMCDSQPLEKRNVMVGKIIMEDNTFIASNCTVMPNVILREGAVIGANTFVPTGYIAEEYRLYWSDSAKLQKYRKRPDEV